MTTLGEVLVVVGDDNNQLALSKAIIGSDQRLASLNEWASSYNSSMKSGGSTYVSEKSLQVAGVDAYMITFQESGYYVTNVAIIKNGAGYLVTYASKVNDQQILEKILNSLTIP